MSLINEALKRAKQAQNVAPPPPASNLEFRPVDPPAAPASTHSLMLAATLVVVLLLAVLLIWQMAHSGRTQVNATQPTTVAREVAPTPAAPVAAAVPATPSPRPPDPMPVPKELSAASEPAKAVAAVPEPEPAPSAAVTPVTELTPPKPAPKLQSIVYSPTRPSALISGKVVFVGDKFGEWRVAAINQESATLVSAGQTNILVLP